MKQILNSHIRGAIRQVGYFGLMILFALGMWKAGDIYKSIAVQEHGILETAQSAILFTAALCYIINAMRAKACRSLLWMLGMILMLALVREQDAYFDDLIPVIGWKWGWIFPVIGGIILYRDKAQLLREGTRFIQSNAFHMMICAAVVMIPVAQCLGHRSYLQDLLSNPYYDISLIRRILEESIELIVYFIILLSSVESFVEFSRKAED